MDTHTSSDHLSDEQLLARRLGVCNWLEVMSNAEAALWEPTLAEFEARLLARGLHVHASIQEPMPKCIAMREVRLAAGRSDDERFCRCLLPLSKAQLWEAYKLTSCFQGVVRVKTLHAIHMLITGSGPDEELRRADALHQENLSSAEITSYLGTRIETWVGLFGLGEMPASGGREELDV